MFIQFVSTPFDPNVFTMAILGGGDQVGEIARSSELIALQELHHLSLNDSPLCSNQRELSFYLSISVLYLVLLLVR